ncbi:MAG: hypothetical protein M9894_33140 [Planctomycetes bacterium]|nr:hypothetical protein [Planctomycetota bacterium]
MSTNMDTNLDRRDLLRLEGVPREQLEQARTRAAARRRALERAGLTGYDLEVSCKGCNRFLASWKGATLEAHLRRDVTLECPGCGRVHELRGNKSRTRLYLRSGPVGQPLVEVERAEVTRGGKPVWEPLREDTAASEES